jgi:hypothetical protein
MSSKASRIASNQISRTAMESIFKFFIFVSLAVPRLLEINFYSFEQNVNNFFQKYFHPGKRILFTKRKSP